MPASASAPTAPWSRTAPGPPDPPAGPARVTRPPGRPAATWCGPRPVWGPGVPAGGPRFRLSRVVPSSRGHRGVRPGSRVWRGHGCGACSALFRIGGLGVRLRPRVSAAGSRGVACSALFRIAGVRPALAGSPRFRTRRLERQRLPRAERPGPSRRRAGSAGEGDFRNKAEQGATGRRVGSGRRWGWRLAGPGRPDESWCGIRA